MSDGSCTPPPPPNNGEGGIDIYPNPVTNPFVISLHDFNDETATIAIYNKLGQRIFNQNISLIYGMAKVNVALSTWAKAVYIVKVMSGGKTITKQFVR